jgi:hypothetical protein
MQAEIWFKFFSGLLYTGVNRYVEVYDWLKWRGNFLRASFDSQIVGNNVCSSLAEGEKEVGDIKNLHVIGVSVGAFAADSCVKIFDKVSEYVYD